MKTTINSRKPNKSTYKNTKDTYILLLYKTEHVWITQFRAKVSSLPSSILLNKQSTKRIVHTNNLYSTSLLAIYYCTNCPDIE